MAKKSKPRRRPIQKKANPSITTKPKRPGHITNGQRQREKRQRKELLRAVDSAQHRLHLLQTGQISRETAHLLTIIATRSRTVGRSAS